MQPDRVFEFEPAAARDLEWLPLAVRYKLDLCGLKIGLNEWQALALEQRQALLRCPAGRAFDALVLELAPGVRRLADRAGDRSGRQAPPTFAAYLLEKSSALLKTA
jgi:hypothetical protein